MDPDMILHSSSVLNNTIVLGGIGGCSDLYGTNRSMALKHQYGLMCQPRILASALHSEAIGAIDINTEPDNSRATDPVIAF